MLHPELRIMAQEMVFTNYKVSAIHQKLLKHVTTNWFYKQTLPDRDSRKYFPRKVAIRNLRERLFQLCLFSDEDLERMEGVVDTLKRERPLDNVWLEVKQVDQQDDVDEIFLEDTAENLMLLIDEQQTSGTLDEENISLNDTAANNASNKGLKNTRRVKQHFHAFSYVYQSAWQQRMLQRYGGVTFITEVKVNHLAERALTFKTYLVMVQTNVDFQIAGVILHSKIRGATSLGECLERFKSFSVQWAPKYFVVDVSEPIFAAIESAFPGILL